MLEHEGAPAQTADFIEEKLAFLNEEQFNESPFFAEQAEAELSRMIGFATRLDEPLIALHHVRAFALAFEGFQTRAVLEARSRGASWPAIGRALGISHQAARQRYQAADETVRRLDRTEPPHQRLRLVKPT